MLQGADSRKAYSHAPLSDAPSAPRGRLLRVYVPVRTHLDREPETLMSPFSVLSFLRSGKPQGYDPHTPHSLAKSLSSPYPELTLPEWVSQSRLSRGEDPLGAKPNGFGEKPGAKTPQPPRREGERDPSPGT